MAPPKKTSGGEASVAGPALPDSLESARLEREWRYLLSKIENNKSRLGVVRRRNEANLQPQKRNGPSNGMLDADTPRVKNEPIYSSMFPLRALGRQELVGLLGAVTHEASTRERELMVRLASAEQRAVQAEAAIAK